MPTNFISKLDIFQELIVDSISDTGEKIIIHVTRQDKRPTCTCGSKKMHIHDWRTHTIQDLPIYNKPSIIKVKKQRYRCISCNKRITSSVSFCSKNHRLSKRVFDDIPLLLKRQNFTDCAFHLGISITSVMRAFTSLPDKIVDTGNVVVLHIDEFKGTSRAGKYQTLLVDGITRKIIDVLPTRNQRDLVAYFKAFKKAPEICVIDMWHPFYRAIKIAWKDSIIIADKFHYVRQILWKVRNIRIQLQKLSEFKIFKRYWKLFTINSNKLSKKQIDRVNELLSLHPLMKAVYQIKYIFDTTVTNQRNSNAHEAFDNWLDYLQSSDVPELVELFNTFENWYAEVVASFYYTNTNGIIEGYNNRIKTIKRQSYGIKSFYNLKKLVCLKVA